MDEGGRGLGRLLAEGREAEVFLRADGTVLKLHRAASPGAERVRREAVALGILGAAGIRAPRVVDQVVVDGRPGLVLERIEGDDLLTRLGRRPFAVVRGGRVMGEVHAAMHETVAPTDLPDVRAEMRRRITDGPQVPDDVRSGALAVLDGLPDGDRLCHTDLHLANILGSWSAPVVIDWGGAGRGDPHADVSRTALVHRISPPPPGAPFLVRTLAPIGRGLLRSGYLAAYRRRRPVDADLFDRWTVANAAVRLTEEVPGEEPGLLHLLRASLASAA